MMKKCAAHDRKGFTLLELLLSIGVLTLMITGLTQVFDSWYQAAVNRSAASDMLRMQRGAEDYVLANFANLIDATKAGNCRASFQPLPIAALKAEGYLPASFREDNRYGQNMTIYCRRVPDGAVANSGEAIEVLTLAGEGASEPRRVAFNDLRDAANAGGPKMGVIATGTIGVPYTGRARALTNDWTVTLADVAGYGSSADATGGFLASYGRVRLDTAVTNNEILYRVPMGDDIDGDGLPDLNRMAVNLDMNGQKLENVGTTVADFMDVTGQATFNGNSSTTGAKAPKALTVEQVLQVEGPSSFVRSRMSANCQRVPIDAANPAAGYNFVSKTSGAACPADELIGGDLVLLDNGNDTRLTANAITVDNQVTAPNLDVRERVRLRRDSRIMGAMQVQNAAGTGTITATQAVAPELEAATMSLHDVQSTSTTVTGSTNMRIGGVIAGNSQVRGNADLRRLQMDNSMKVSNNATMNGNVTVTRRAYIDRRKHNYINCTNALKNADGVKCSNE